jgi:hypothetical protein
MNSRTEKQETYREQLSRLARSLVMGHNADVYDDLAAGSTPARVRSFTDGNLDRRFERLARQVEPLSQAFRDLADLILCYIRTIPQAACDSSASDGERFLDWLERTQSPLPEQRDYITCQRARHAVEAAARANRLGHVRFQELSSLADALAGELELNRSLEIRLNPIRVWATFETAELLDESAVAPATVVFFPVGAEIHTVVLEGDGLERVRELAGFGPVTLDEWLRMLEPFAGFEGVRRRDLIAFCRDLAELGLVGFA